MSTATRIEPGAAGSTASPRPSRSRLVSLAPALLSFIAVVVILIMVDTPVSALIRYAIYWLVGVLIPGMLVHRALRGRPKDVVTDVSMGAATGIVLGLAGWVIFMVLHIQDVLWIWPLLVIAVFVAVPALRTSWTLAPYAERVGKSAWWIAGALAFYACSLAMTHMRTAPLPPAANLYYIDVYWHMANAAELMRSLPPDIPSVAGRTLRYHYLVNAHIGLSHQMTGVDLATVYLRLWEIPVIATVIGLLFSFTRKITGRGWAAALAAVLLIAPTQLIPWAWFKPWASYALTEGSPSQVAAVLILLMLAIILLPLIQGGSLTPGSWALLVACAICAPAAKPSVLPVLLFGLGLVFLLRLFRRPREGLRSLLAVMAICLVALAALMPLVAQSASGSGVKLFGLLYFIRIWTSSVNKYVYPGTGGHVIPGLDSSSAMTLAILILLAILMQFAFVLAGSPLLRRGFRTNPVVLFLFGGWLIGMIAALIVDHPGASEIYFARTGTPFAIVLAVWGVVEAVDRAREGLERRQVVAIGAGSAVVGAVLAWLAVRSGDGARPTRGDLHEALAKPMIFLVVAGLVLAAIYFVVRQTAWRRLRGAGALVFCATLLGVFVSQGPWTTTRAAADVARGDGPAHPLAAHHITEDETVAAIWMKDHTPRDAIVATNMHCLTKKSTPRCQYRSYWLPAFTERRFVVESWAYTEETLLKVGQYPGGFATYPFDDPKLLELNDSAFSHPTKQILDTLRDKHHAQYLYADPAASPISPELDRLATLRYSKGNVRIYELKP